MRKWCKAGNEYLSELLLHGFSYKEVEFFKLVREVMFDVRRDMRGIYDSLVRGCCSKTDIRYII